MMKIFSIESVFPKILGFNLFLFVALFNSAYGATQNNPVDTQIETSSHPYDERKWNLTAAPLSLIFGVFDLQGAYVIGPKATLGLKGYIATYSAYNGRQFSPLGGALNLTYYLSNKALTDSWYVAPEIGLLPLETYTSASNVFFTGAIFGYHWVYHSGFNMMAGIGGHYYSISHYETSSYLHGFRATLSFRIGYAF